MSNETKLEKQLNSLFENTLEQKAIDVALKVWEGKSTGKGHIDDDKLRQAVNLAVEGGITSFNPYDFACMEKCRISFCEEFTDRLTDVVRKESIEQAVGFISEIIKKQYADRMHETCRHVLKEVFGEWLKEVDNAAHDKEET